MQFMSEDSEQSPKSKSAFRLSGRQRALLVFLIVMILFGGWYFSPEARCKRQAKKEVYSKAAVADVSEIPDAYRSILQDAIKAETQKCLEGR